MNKEAKQSLCYLFRGWQEYWSQSKWKINPIVVEISQVETVAKENTHLQLYHISSKCFYNSKIWYWGFLPGSEVTGSSAIVWGGKPWTPHHVVNITGSCRNKQTFTLVCFSSTDPKHTAMCQWEFIQSPREHDGTLKDIALNHQLHHINTQPFMHSDN